MKCPYCQTKVPSQSINIQKDIAQCQNCEKVFKISDNVPSKSTKGLSDYDLAMDSLKKENKIDKNSTHLKTRRFDINNPPKKAYIEHFDDGLKLGARTNSWFALFIVPFAVVWTGGALGGIFGSQIINGEFNILITLFGVPFVIASGFLWAFTGMLVFGKTEITLKSSGGYIFTGVGKFGSHKRFEWSEIDSVRQEKKVTRNRKSSSTTYQIVLEGQRQVKFGRYLNSETRYYMLKSLEQIIANR